MTGEIGWRPRANLPGGLMKTFSHLGAQGYKTLARADGRCSSNLSAAGGCVPRHTCQLEENELYAISQRLPLWCRQQSEGVASESCRLSA